MLVIPFLVMLGLASLASLIMAGRLLPWLRSRRTLHVPRGLRMAIYVAIVASPLVAWLLLQREMQPDKEALLEWSMITALVSTVLLSLLYILARALTGARKPAHPSAQALTGARKPAHPSAQALTGARKPAQPSARPESDETFEKALDDMTPELQDRLTDRFAQGEFTPPSTAGVESGNQLQNVINYRPRKSAEPVPPNLTTGVAQEERIYTLHPNSVRETRREAAGSTLHVVGHSGSGSGLKVINHPATLVDPADDPMLMETADEVASASELEVRQQLDQQQIAIEKLKRANRRFADMTRRQQYKLMRCDQSLKQSRKLARQAAKAARAAAQARQLVLEQLARERHLREIFQARASRSS